MKTPQIVLIALYSLSLGISMAKHGKPREPYNFWTSFLAVIIEVAILWWGGFWRT